MSVESRRRCASGSSSVSVWPEIRRVATSELRLRTGGSRAESRVRDGDELRVRRRRRRREHERHPIDQQRLRDAPHQPFAQAEQIQVAVEIARKADERAPVVVAIAVVHAIEAGLNRVLHRTRQQHEDHRGEERDDVVRAGTRGIRLEHLLGEAQQDRVEGGNRRDRGGVHQTALDDDLDVHQPVADDGGRERERHEPEEDRRQLEGARRLEPERERQRVAEGERHRAEARAPHDPSKLAPRRHGAHAVERARHDHEPGNQAQPQVEVLGAVDERQDFRHHLALTIGAQQHRDLRDEEKQRRQVEDGQQRAAVVALRPAVRPLREDEREVHEEGRQHQERNGIAPEEHPVQQIEAAAVRERERAEERDRQPEEVQRRLILRPAQPDRRADHQREETDAREGQIQPMRPGRDAGHRHRDEIGRAVRRALPDDDVVENRPGPGAVQDGHDIGRCRNHATADLEEHVSRAEPREAAGRALGDDACGHVVSVRDPEHAVFHLRPPFDGDVHRRKNDQAADDGQLNDSSQQDAPIHACKSAGRQGKFRSVRSKRRSPPGGRNVPINHWLAKTSAAEPAGFSNEPDRDPIKWTRPGRREIFRNERGIRRPRAWAA